MRTPNQTQASRANGAKSKGPVTPQGKLNSSRNSTRHGLYAETIVLEAEDKSQFLELLDELFEEHQPCTCTERMLVETIAAARWRQDRIIGMQKVAFDYDIASSPTQAEFNPLRAVLGMRSPESARTHEILLRYEVALDRQISRALLRLHQLQDRRLQTPPKNQKSAAEERTRQPAETVTPPPPSAAKTPLRPAAQNPTSAPKPPSSSESSTRKAVPLPPARHTPSRAPKKSAA